jgi:hypothetical protein
MSTSMDQKKERKLECVAPDLPRTSVVCSGIFHPHAPNKKQAEERLPRNWRNKGGPEAALALDLLQISSDTPIAPESLHTCLQYEYEALPPQVRDLVYVPEPGSARVFGDDLVSTASGEEPANEWEGAIEREPAFVSLVDEACKRDYVIWAVDAGMNNWVVVVLKLGRGGDDPDVDMEGAETRLNNEVQAWAVVHPERDVPSGLAKLRVKKRVQHLLQKNGVSWDDSLPAKDLWVPPMSSQHLAAGAPKDTFSTGLRAFALSRELLARSTYAVSMRKVDCEFESELWKPLSGWFHADKVRRDMIGAASSRLLEVLGHRVRMAATPIRSFPHGDQFLASSDLQEPDYRHHTLYLPEPEDPDRLVYLEGKDVLVVSVEQADHRESSSIYGEGKDEDDARSESESVPEKKNDAKGEPVVPGNSIAVNVAGPTHAAVKPLSSESTKRKRSPSPCSDTPKDQGGESQKRRRLSVDGGEHMDRAAQFEVPTEAHSEEQYFEGQTQSTNTLAKEGEHA